MLILKGFYKETNELNHKESLLFSFFNCRKPGGIFYNNIAEDIASHTGFSRLMYDVLIYILGRKISFFLFPKMNVEKKSVYTDGGFLYHLTPVENINKIKQKGIVSKRNYIFLTDNIEYFANNDDYLNWKATELKKDTDFCVLKINAAALCKRRKIFYINRKHEFVTEKVEPEFIIFD